MILYHGSYCKIEKPNIEFSRNNLDFGKGFYLTNIKKQAEDWAKIIAKKQNKKAILNTYILEETLSDYSIKNFIKYDESWFDFIVKCRKGEKVYKEYDIIVGAVADDVVFQTLNLFDNNLLDKEEALNRLKYKKPNSQMCIVSQDVLDSKLKFIRSEHI